MKTSNLIPVQPLADRVNLVRAEQGISLSEICRNLGWVRIQRGREKPDTTRLRRSLGQMPYTTVQHGRTYRITRQKISYDIAVRIAKAAGIDPVDAGL